MITRRLECLLGFSCKFSKKRLSRRYRNYRLTKSPSTGATGLIGGDYLIVITQKHPEWEVSVLIRDAEKEKLVRKHFPHVRTVQGSLEDYSLLERESKAADVVLSQCHDGLFVKIA